jgi:nicotinate-nucleotide pyrophosphorylase (carboxylating)
MVKDNHLKALASQGVSMAQAVRELRSRHPDMVLEIEADTEEQVKEALEAGADVILLDNMSPELLRRCVESVGRKAQTEASGGVCLDSVREIAETGVDFISVGALTHSAGSVDIALDFEDF